MNPHPLTGLKLLVVEDEYLLADEMVRAIVYLGGQVIGPVSNLEAAAQLMESQQPDGAVLDVHLRDGLSFALADQLLARGKPCLFASGADRSEIPPRLASAMVAAKPFSSQELQQHLINMFDGQSRPSPVHLKAATSSEKLDSQPIQSEADLRAALQEARLAVAVRDEFIAEVAHELRNPMTPIAAQVERLLNHVARPNATVQGLKPGLEALHRAIDYYLRRATALLEISRITTGRLQLYPKELSLTVITREAVVRYGPMAEHAGTVITADGVQDDVIGIWDQMAVEQILDNLISNALKYGYEGPVRITLSSDGLIAVLSVADQGVGISAENQARIFERFEQAAGSRGRGGFGLGLWLVHQLVQAMDGEILVESVLGSGSTFTIRLPLRAMTAARSGDELI